MKILELGNYVVPAYAGMILAEQGHQVEKWTNGQDPILGCQRGGELWAWINEGKTLRDCHPCQIEAEASRFDAILDNFRPATLQRWASTPRPLPPKPLYRGLACDPKLASVHST